MGGKFRGSEAVKLRVGEACASKNRKSFDLVLMSCGVMCSLPIQVAVFGMAPDV